MKLMSSSKIKDFMLLSNVYYAKKKSGSFNVIYFILFIKLSSHENVTNIVSLFSYIFAHRTPYLSYFDIKKEMGALERHFLISKPYCGGD